MQDKIITIVNLYGPNADTTSFYTSLFQVASVFTCVPIVIRGDSNFDLTYNLRDENGKVWYDSKTILHNMIFYESLCKNNYCNTHLIFSNLPPKQLRTPKAVRVSCLLLIVAQILSVNFYKKFWHLIYLFISLAITKLASFVVALLV